MELNMKNFKPKKSMTYLYFNFYYTTVDNIEEFKAELKNMFPFILGFVDDDKTRTIKDVMVGINQIPHQRIHVYFSSKKEAESIKGDETLKLYKRYVGEEGHKVE